MLGVDAKLFCWRRSRLRPSAFWELDNISSVYLREVEVVSEECKGNVNKWFVVVDLNFEKRDIIGYTHPRDDVRTRSRCV